MIFGITEKDFFDKSKLKIIDTIAGAGKSSMIDKILSDRGIQYGRYTSTNALKRDAEKRYTCHCDTIAGGLFTTEKMKFYSDEKDIEYDTVVIDEILQTSYRVFDWIKNALGKKNIIITTDSKQMLVPASDRLYKTFLALKKSPLVVCGETGDTLRPRDEKTRACFSDMYVSEPDGTDRILKYKKVLHTCSFPEFNKDAVYVCHTNEIENYLYRKYGLSKRYDIDLIPKGAIARKPPKNLVNVPILSQTAAERTHATRYLQAANVGTPTRLQGSEIKGIGYYFIEAKSRVSNRELYTVMTRFYHIDNLYIVYLDLPDNSEITEFCGKPVKKEIYFRIDDELETKTVAGVETIPEERIKAIIKEKDGAEMSGYVYRTDGILTKNGLVRSEKSVSQKDTLYKKPRFTANGLIKKESYFDISYMPAVYRLLEREGYDRIIYPFIKNSTKKEDFVYSMDIFSAYPALLANVRLPIDGEIYPDYSADRLNFYLINRDLGALKKGAMITDSLASLVNPDYLTFLFSTDFVNGSRMGKKLIDLAHKSLEDKQDIKSVHYGYFQKRFLSPAYNEDNKTYRDIDFYILSAFYTKELLMVSIISELSYIMRTVQQEIKSPSFIQVDALHFNGKKNISTVKRVMLQWSWVDYRIKRTMQTEEQVEAVYNDSYSQEVVRLHGGLDMALDILEKLRKEKGVEILEKTYTDLKPRSARSHHKKT